MSKIENLKDFSEKTHGPVVCDENALIFVFIMIFL